MDVGSKGLANVNLIIPQSTTLAFSVVHKDCEGHVIDHTQSTVNMAFQSKNHATTYDLDGCCSATESGIFVVIPSATTENLPIDNLNWDLIVEDTSGTVTRLCYGIATVVDTYALDDEV